MEEKKKHGGARKGGGRPSKADEQLVRQLGLNAIKSVYGSVEKYYEHIAKESKESFPHLKLLQEYVYGKPKETIENINHNIEHDLTEEEARRIAKVLTEGY